MLTLPLIEQSSTDSSGEKPGEKTGRKSDESESSKSAERIAEVIRYLTDHGPATRKEIAEAIGLKPSRASEILSMAVAQQLITAEGKTKDRKFDIHD